MTLTRKWIPTNKYSAGRSSAVRLIVVHTTEGARTIEDLGAWWNKPSTQASSHVGTDDKPNTVGEYVRRPNTAWTQSAANSYCVSNELCSYASWSRATWLSHPNMLASCAAWIAEEAAAFNIPIVRLTPAQAQGGGRGVCGHVDLGAAGGGHTDPGVNFPWSDVLAMAQGGTPEPETGALVMFIRYKSEIWQQCPLGTGNGWYWRRVPKAPTKYPVEDDADGTFFNLWPHQEAGKIVNP